MFCLFSHRRSTVKQIVPTVADLCHKLVIMHDFLTLKELQLCGFFCITKLYFLSAPYFWNSILYVAV